MLELELEEADEPFAPATAVADEPFEYRVLLERCPQHSAQPVEVRRGPETYGAGLVHHGPVLSRTIAWLAPIRVFRDANASYGSRTTSTLFVDISASIAPHPRQSCQTGEPWPC